MAAAPLEYIVTLGNQFSRVTMYSNGDAAADARCGQTLKPQLHLFTELVASLRILTYFCSIKIKTRNY